MMVLSNVAYVKEPDTDSCLAWTSGAEKTLTEPESGNGPYFPVATFVASLVFSEDHAALCVFFLASSC